MPLEPREVLHVESPRLSLQLFGRQIPSNDAIICQVPIAMQLYREAYCGYVPGW